MAHADPDSVSFSIQSDLDNCYNADYFSEPSGNEHRSQPAEKPSPGATLASPTCAGQPLFHGSGGVDTDNSLHLEWDLEMDHLPSDSAEPPSYADAVRPRPSNAQPHALSRQLVGPDSGSDADSNKHKLNAHPIPSPKENRQPERPSVTGQTDSSRTAAKAKRTRTRPTSDEDGSHTGVSLSSGNAEALDTSRGSKVKSTRKSSVTSSGSVKGTSTLGSSKTKSHSLSDSKAVAKVTYPNGANLTANGCGSSSFTVKGNVTINNIIDLRNPRQVPRVEGKQHKLKKIRSPPPAHGSVRRIRTEDIEILSSQLGESWFKIGLSIGVDRGVLENIKAKYPGDQQEMTRQMLVKWTHKFGRKATINYIIDALVDDKIDKYDVAMKLPHDQNC
ncbi:uncharacterized protein [Watersipora subatra]|uniref:uncharacterized protein n=1 Tax=Watersipora subatra TaxID=2589382 RepID=UPI00355B4281